MYTLVSFLLKARIVRSLLMCHIMNKWLSLLSLLVLTTSCRDITEVAGGEDGLSGLVIPGIKEQTQSERTWANVNLTKIMTLPDTSVTVYQLGGVYADERDNIYLVDLGIMKIYQFDSLGNYIKAFGHGVGEGPGEFLQIMDVGVVGDTMMYLLDAYRSAVSFFKLNGEYKWGDGRYLTLLGSMYLPRLAGST